MLEIAKRAISAKVYYPIASSRSLGMFLASEFHRGRIADIAAEEAVVSFWANLKHDPAVGLTFVPVLELHDRHGESADFAIDIFGR